MKHQRRRLGPGRIIVLLSHTEVPLLPYDVQVATGRSVASRLPLGLSAVAVVKAGEPKMERQSTELRVAAAEYKPLVFATY